MIDIDLFTNILENKKEKGFIECNEDIPDNLFSLFINTSAPVSKILTLFKKSKIGKDNHSHKIRIECIKCREFIEYRALNSKQFTGYISTIRGKPPRHFWSKGDYICKTCSRKEKKEALNAITKSNKEREKGIKDNTRFYVNNVLNPDASWKKGTATRAKLNTVFNPEINHDIIQDHIQNMDYKDFLCTIYWTTIAAHVKYKSNYKCQLCESKALPNVHHKNYTRHGLEHLYWRTDLICICQNCHGKFHNKIE